MTAAGPARLERQVRHGLIVDIDLKQGARGEQGDGIELVREVRAHHAQLRILVLSMHDGTIYAQRMFAAGGAYISGNPVDRPPLGIVRATASCRFCT